MQTLKLEVVLSRLSGLVAKVGMFANVPKEDVLGHVFPDFHLDVPDDVETLIYEGKFETEVALQFGAQRFFLSKWAEMCLAESAEGEFRAATNIPIFSTNPPEEYAGSPKIRMDTVLNLFCLSASAQENGEFDFSSFAERCLHSVDVSRPLVGRDEEGKILVRYGNKTFGQGSDGLFKKVDEKWYPVEKRAFGEGLYL